MRRRRRRRADARRIGSCRIPRHRPRYGFDRIDRPRHSVWACDPPVGSSTKTTLSQNAVRNRKNMTPYPHPRHLLFCRLIDRTLSESLESAVLRDAALFRLFEANSRKFADNLNDLHLHKHCEHRDFPEPSRLSPPAPLPPVRERRGCRTPPDLGNGRSPCPDQLRRQTRARVGRKGPFRRRTAAFLSFRLSGL